MKLLKDIFGTLIGMVMVLVFALAIIALIFSLAADQMPGLRALTADARCLTGLASDASVCGRGEIARLNDKVAALGEELEVAKNGSGGQNLVFEQGVDVTDVVSVVVGTIFRQKAGQNVPVRSFCFVNLDDKGLDPRLVLAIKEPDGTISEGVITVSDLALFGIGAADIHAARRACQFPDMP